MPKEMAGVNRLERSPGRSPLRYEKRAANVQEKGKTVSGNDDGKGRVGRQKTTWIAYLEQCRITYSLDRTQRNSWSDRTDALNHWDAWQMVGEFDESKAGHRTQVTAVVEGGYGLTPVALEIGRVRSADSQAIYSMRIQNQRNTYDPVGGDRIRCSLYNRRGRTPGTRTFARHGK